MAVDEERIREIHLQAFGDGEGELVADLASALMHEASEPAIHGLVAEVKGVVAGHIAFSPVRARAGQDLVGYILAPLAVDPRYQGHGVGERLVRDGLGLLAHEEVGMVFVYGDPAYYGRFGFAEELAGDFEPPFGLRFPHGWQAVELGDRPPAREGEAIECVKALSKKELW